MRAVGASQVDVAIAALRHRSASHVERPDSSIPTSRNSQSYVVRVRVGARHLAERRVFRAWVFAEIAGFNLSTASNT